MDLEAVAMTSELEVGKLLAVQVSVNPLVSGAQQSCGSAREHTGARNQTEYCQDTHFARPLRNPSANAWPTVCSIMGGWGCRGDANDDAQPFA